MFRQKYREIHNFFSTNQKGDDKATKISYKIKFIDSYRFMSTSLSNLVNNLS